ncbi:hypothetical protein DQ226_10270 [Dietzia maris]|uniref:Uncharacterized protein n=1 Tax=Dietzia maris TaxID=37915 RepID=A0A365PA43_9ACTN|nr:hypothetical protein DQ226_10270 [Dietzia maris]
MTTGTASRLSPSDVLDIASVAFGRLLREREVAVSPAEVVELRTVLAMVGRPGPRPCGRRSVR